MPASERLPDKAQEFVGTRTSCPASVP